MPASTSWRATWRIDEPGSMVKSSGLAAAHRAMGEPRQRPKAGGQGQHCGQQSKNRTSSGNQARRKRTKE
jgi:hypothetical protein